MADFNSDKVDSYIKNLEERKAKEAEESAPLDLSKELAQPPTPEALESFVESIPAGATLEFSDELSGVLAAGQAMSTSPAPLSQEELLRRYREARDLSRQAQKQRQEEHPVASFMGEAAGGLALPIGELGLASKGLKAAAEGAKTGASLGAVAGLGVSEADLTQGEVGEAGKDIAKGAIGGAALGATLPALASAKRGVKNVEFVQDVGQAFQKGVEGQNLATKTGREQLVKDIGETSKGIYEDLKNEVTQAAQMKEAALQQAGEQGIVLDMEKKLQKYRDMAKALPEDTRQQRADKRQIVEFIERKLEGTPQEMEVSLPAYTSVQKGEQLPSGEAVALEKLQSKLAKVRASKEMKSPELTAESKLKEQFAKQKLSSEFPNKSEMGEISKELVSGTGKEGIAVIGPQGGLLSQVIKDISPGEIKIVTDPVTGKRFQASVDLSGKAYIEPIEEIGERTNVSFERVPEKTIKLQAFEGAKTKMLPKELSEYEKSASTMTALGERSVQTPKAKKAIGDIEKGLKTELRESDVMGAYGDIAKSADEQMAAAMTAKDILFKNAPGLSQAEKLSIEQGIAQKIRSSEVEGETGHKAQRIIEAATDALRKTNPELADKISKKVKDQAIAYDLARKISRETIAPGTAKTLFGSVKGATIGGANLAGQAKTKVSDFVRGVTPEVLTNLSNSFSQKNPELSAKLLKAADELKSRGSKSTLFAIMQTPSYKDALKLTDKE